MKKAILDFTNCKYYDDLHETIKKSFNFPDYYGKNLDAFWDCISCDCDINFVTILGSKKVPDDLKSTVKKIIDMLEGNKQEWANSDCPFDYEVIS